MARHPTGAEILAATLERRGISKLFTLSGNHIMPVFDALLDTGITLIHTRHEAASVHMADAWARLTGQVGVALVTGGPGHANATAALFTATAAESPVVLLSGHAGLSELGRGAFQELDQTTMARPVTKASWVAQSASTLEFELGNAIEIAHSGRPGPVHLSLPIDVLEARVQASVAPASGNHGASAGAALGPEAAAAVVAELIAAQRPIIVCGPTMCTDRGRATMRALEQTLAVPVVAMESPRGLNDATLGRFASVLARADLLLLLGKPLDFTLHFGEPPAVARDCRFVVLDPDPAMIARAARSHGERVAYAACTDVGIAVRALLSSDAAVSARSSRWRDEVRAAVAYRPPEWQTMRSGAGAVHPLDVSRALEGFIARHPETILVCDGGEFSQWVQAAVSTERRMINGVAGSIGGSLPFALAAKAAAPNAPVIAVMGDGTFGFHMAELETAVRCALPVVVVIGNDSRWNAEYQIQLRRYGSNRARGCELLPARYEQVATALGDFGAFATEPGALPGLLQQAWASGKPSCLNVLIESAAAPDFSAS